MVNKYVKKWGGKVGEAKIDVEGTYKIYKYSGKEWGIDDVKRALDVSKQGGHDVFYSPLTGEKLQFPFNRDYVHDTLKIVHAAMMLNRGSFKNAVEQNGAHLADAVIEDAFGGTFRGERVKNKTAVHSLDITPAMLESVMQGQPLFSRRPELGSQIQGFSNGRLIAVGNPQMDGTYELRFPFGTNKSVHIAENQAMAEALLRLAKLEVKHVRRPTQESLENGADGVNIATKAAMNLYYRLPGIKGGALAEGEGKLNLWDKTIGHPYNLAQKSEEFNDFFWAGQKYLGDINTLIVQSQDIIPSWMKGNSLLMHGIGKLIGKETGSSNKVGRILTEGTLYGGGNPLAGKIFSDAELAKQGLNKKEIRMYHEARAMADDMITKTGAAMIKLFTKKVDRIEWTKTKDGIQIEGFADKQKVVSTFEKVKHMHSAVGEAISEKIKDDPNQSGRIDGKDMSFSDSEMKNSVLERIAALKKGGYWPLSRWGDHYVSVINSKDEVIDYRMYESKKAAIVGQALLKRVYAKHPGVTSKRGTLSSVDSKLYPGLTFEAMEMFADKVGKIDDAIVQERLKIVVNSRSAMKKMIHRKGTAGYNIDTMRVIGDFVVKNARYVSSTINMPEMAITAQAIKAGNVREYAVNMIEYLRNPKEEFNQLRAYAFFHFLGGNITAALTNLTQVPMLTMPELTKHVGHSRAVLEMTRAFKDALRIKSLSGDLGKAMQRAEKEGVTNAQNAYQMMGLAQGSAIARIGELSQALDAWASLFAAAEKQNRRSTFIAAYRIARSVKKMNHEDAYHFASVVVDDTQFIYNKGNRPVFGRGIGAPLLIFKQYPIAFLELLARKPLKQRMYILLMLALVSGLEGLPSAENLEDLLDALGQQFGFNTNSKKWIKETLEKLFQEYMSLSPEQAQTLTEVVRHGVFTLTPFSIGPRLSMGRPIPGTAALKKSETNITKDLTDTLGAGYGIFENAYKAGASAYRGDFGRAVELAAPRGVANVVSGMRQFREGKETTAKHLDVVPVTKTQAVGKMIGVTPESVAKFWRDSFTYLQTENFKKVMETQFLDRWAYAEFTGDNKEVEKVRKEIDQFNAGKEQDEKILTNNSKNRVRVNSRKDKMKESGRERMIKKVSPERRPLAREQFTPSS